MDMDTPTWLVQLREELDGMPSQDRISVAAAWTTLITNEVLAELGDRRRSAVVETVLALGGPSEIPRLAETVGTRVNVIQRLWEEGRKLARMAAHRG